MMNKRQLGRSGLQVAPLALGGNVFGWNIDEATSFQILDRWAGAGFNLVDTADIYSRWAPGNQGGESETIIGRWVKSRGLRDKLIIATKAGGDMGQGKKDLSKEYITQAVESSLRRLQTDYIDLYQSHWDDETTPVEETIEAYADLVKAGKVRVIGASNFTLTRLKASLEVSARVGLPRYETVQPQYNLYDRQEFEQTMEPLCVDLQIGVISYYSLARGFLSGKYRSEGDLAKSVRGGGIGKYLNDRGSRILRALDEVAAQYKTSPASVALAWLIARPSVTAPISSATSTEQLDDLVEAASLSLDRASMEQLNKASDY